MFCPNCGSELNEVYAFCPFCGAKTVQPGSADSNNNAAANTTGGTATSNTAETVNVKNDQRYYQN